MLSLETIARIWRLTVESNTFNFIIFAAIIAWILKKINIGFIIASLQQKIIKILEEVKKEAETAKNKLIYAEKSVEKLEDELNVIVEDAKKSAETISRKILSEAEKQLEDIESNAQKVIAAEEKFFISKLAKNTSKASVEAAKIRIQDVLKQTPALHEKYINESIEELDRLKF